MAYKNPGDQKAAAHRHYLANKDKYYATGVEQRKKQFQDRKKRVKEYLLEHPCVDCKESDPIVLDFDHVNPSEKTANISKMVRARNSWSLILEEIQKCEVRCANCHRRRTAKQFGWN